MPDQITLTLTSEQAAEIHTLCDVQALDNRICMRKFAAVPAMARLFEHGAQTCDAICAAIEAEYPEFAVLAERPR